MSQVQDPIVTLTLPLSRVNLILNALAEQPAKLVIGTLAEVQRQARAAIQAQEPATGLIAAPSTPADGRAEGQ